MALSLADVRRIVAEIAHEDAPAVEVVAAHAEADSTYTEIILTLRGCSTEPCQILMGLSRDASESEFRDTVRERLREHLHEHERSDVTTSRR